ncbi:putative F-box/LRR-repeat protein At5g38386 [Rutidosis leptorrhynchoides]|uniref:putative F-box/LRR-repeat protein At5g38386 n=1 Tax=Rutidosis leptorrhynchoides TaxID=125765 RepID=UPI003A99D3B9
MDFLRQATSAKENDSKDDVKGKQVAEVKSKIRQPRKPPIPLIRPLSLKDKSKTSKFTSHEASLSDKNVTEYSKAVSNQHLNKRKVAPGDRKTTKIEVKDKLTLEAESNERQRTHNKVTPKDSKTMKLRLRSFKTKKSLIVRIPNPCTLQHLKKLVSQKLPSTSNSLALHLSLNQKDVLTTTSPKDSVQSIGITSDDLVYFTTNPNGFCTNDFINQMPDDVLVLIPSFLSIKEAAITSTLSTRWRHLWRHLIQLNFHNGQTFNDPVSYSSECKKYINQVNSVIQSYNHPVIKEFRIRYCLKKDRYKSVIREWLQFAANKKVEFLELDLSDMSVGGVNEFLMGVVEIDLMSSLFTFDNMVVSLKKLILTSVGVNDTIFQKLLSHSPNLETLSIYHVYPLKHIHVSGRALKLKHFEIENYCHSVSSIYLSDFDLESFTYVGQRVDLSLSRLPKLKKLNLGKVNWLVVDDVVARLSLSCASSLESLSVCVEHGKQCLCPNQFCELPNVKHLRLAFKCSKRDCLLDLAHTVNAFPSLESFKLEIHCTSTFVRRPTRDDTNPHQHLKYVEIVGCQGRKCDFELVAYIIEIAVVLKKIVIRTLKDCSEEKARLSATRLAKRLESMLAQDVKLVVV